MPGVPVAPLVLAVVVILLALCATPTRAAAYGFSLQGMFNGSGEIVPAPTPSPGLDASALNETSEQDCRDQIGKVEDGVPINTMRKYDVEKLLSELGGAPGKVNATWNREVPELTQENPDKTLQDTHNTTFWVYDYKRTDFTTFLRREHGLLRRRGQPDEYVEVRGELYWTPPDFCGRARHATYSVSPATGFEADVKLIYCNFNGGGQLYCATPAYCSMLGEHRVCVG